FKNTSIDFVSKRKITYFISGIIIAAGFVSFFTRGFNMGVDFKGGRSYVVQFDDEVNTVGLSQSLGTILDGNPEVKTYGGSGQVKITTDYRIDDQGETVDSEVESIVKEGLGAYGEGGSFEIMSIEKVGPTIADDI